MHGIDFQHQIDPPMALPSSGDTTTEYSVLVAQLETRDNLTNPSLSETL